MAGIRYGRIKKGMRHLLAPVDPERYTVRERPEERFYFRFKLVLAGLVVFFGVLLLPLGKEGRIRAWTINTEKLKKYENLVPDRRVLVAYVDYLQERRR